MDIITSVLADTVNLLSHLIVWKKSEHNSSCLLCNKKENAILHKPKMLLLPTSSDLELLHSGNNAIRQLVFYENSKSHVMFQRELCLHLKFHLTNTISLNKFYDILVIVCDTYISIDILQALLPLVSKHVVIISTFSIALKHEKFINIICFDLDIALQAMTHFLMITDHRMRISDWNKKYGTIVYTKNTNNNINTDRCLFI